MANQLNSLYDKYFKEEADGSLIFNGERLIVRIPPYFYESGVTRVNQTVVETMGIFEGLIFDDPDEDDLTKYSHKFTYISGNKNDDILLKNVNLIETRRTYIKDCTELIQFIYYNLSDIMNGAEHVIEECDFAPKFNNKSSKKKSRRNRR